MKNTNLTILLLVCFLCSCTLNSNKETLLPELVHAESLMYDQPDSALSILETMAMPAPSEELQNATWSLLLVQARDKNRIVHYSDSLINVASDYFMKQDDPWRKALVLNYEGRVNEDMGEIEKATRFYLEGCDMARQTDDYKLRFLLTSNLGTLYLYQGLNKKALEAYTDAKILAQKMNDSGYLSAAYSYLGRVYSVTGCWDDAVLSYKEAIKKAELSDEKSDLSRALGELAAVYEANEKYDSAFIYLEKDEEFTITNRLSGLAQIYLGIGSLYSRLEVYDSAQTYLNKSLLSVPNLYTKKSVYKELSGIADKQGDCQEAFANMKLFQITQDTIQQQDKYKEIAELQARYNHEKLRNENVRLEVEKDRVVKMALYILLVLSIIVYLYQRKLLNKERVLRKQNEQLEHNAVQLFENEEEIRKNRDRIRILMEGLRKSSDREKEEILEIEKLNGQREQLEKENIELQKSMEKSVLLRQYNKLMQDFRTLSFEAERISEYEQYLYRRLVERIPILNSLCNELKCINSEEQWMEIETATDLLYNNFTKRLKSNIPEIKTNDVRFCCLIKLQFSNTKIATLTMVDTPAVTKHKQRLKKMLSLALEEDFSKRNSIDEWVKQM